MIGLFFGMDARFLLAICLLCVLEVDCQTSSRLSFGNDNVLPNHSYVDLGMVGTSFMTSVQCHTGNYSGQWYFPDDEPLQNRSEDGDIYQVEPDMNNTRVDLRRRNNANSPTGIYHCEIVVSGNADGARVYVGLYINEGKYSGTSE